MLFNSHEFIIKSHLLFNNECRLCFNHGCNLYSIRKGNRLNYGYIFDFHLMILNNKTKYYKKIWEHKYKQIHNKKYEYFW